MKKNNTYLHTHITPFSSITTHTNKLLKKKKNKKTSPSQNHLLHLSITLRFQRGHFFEFCERERMSILTRFDVCTGDEIGCIKHIHSTSSSKSSKKNKETLTVVSKPQSRHRSVTSMYVDFFNF